MMKHYIPIETNMMDSDAVCALINKYGMRGYGMYMAIIVELRKHNNYSCGTDSLRAMARKCNVRFAFLLSVITDFGLFNVEETEDGKIRISSEYVNRVMLLYDKKVRRCKESEVPEVKEHPETQKAENDSNPIAIEENIKEKNTASEELHSSSAEDTVVAADALEFVIRHIPDDEVCRRVVGAPLEVQSGFIRHTETADKGSPPPDNESFPRRDNPSGTEGEKPHGSAGTAVNLGSPMSLDSGLRSRSSSQLRAEGTRYSRNVFNIKAYFQHAPRDVVLHYPESKDIGLPRLTAVPAEPAVQLRSKQIRIALKTNKDPTQNK